MAEWTIVETVLQCCAAFGLDEWVEVGFSFFGRFLFSPKYCATVYNERRPGVRGDTHDMWFFAVLFLCFEEGVSRVYSC